MNHVNSFNQVILIGRLGHDPVLKKSKGNNPTSFVSFSVATYKKFRGGKKITNWSQISYWGDKQSEWATEYLKKGMLIQVNGEINTRKYKDPQGIERKATDVRAYEIIMLASPKNIAPMDQHREEPEEQDPEPERTEPERTEEPATAVEKEEDFY